MLSHPFIIQGCEQGQRSWHGQTIGQELSIHFLSPAYLPPPVLPLLIAFLPHLPKISKKLPLFCLSNPVSLQWSGGRESCIVSVLQ